MVIKDGLPDADLVGIAVRNALFGRDFLTQPSHEKAFNAPVVAVVLALSMPALYLFQGLYFSSHPQAWDLYAFRPSSLADGTWWPGVATSMVVHGNWAHAFTNGVAALAFGPPVARQLKGGVGVLAFLLFYIACGLAAAIGYGLLHPSSSDLLVGASGAVFGLMAAGLRLLRRRNGVPRRLADRRFLVPAGVLMAVNVATGLVGFAPGMEGVRVAWEAHAVGFVAGALLIGPWLKLFGRPGFDSPPEVGDAAS